MNWNLFLFKYNSIILLIWMNKFGYPAFLTILITMWYINLLSGILKIIAIINIINIIDIIYIAGKPVWL